MKEFVTEARALRFRNVISRRQDFTVILENVHDPHNIGAVIRSCDAVGVSEVFILYTEDSQNLIKQEIGRNSSSGARKWVKSHYYSDLESCFHDVRIKYPTILGTHLSEDANSLYDLDLTGPVALMFGNEQKGISNAALKNLDGNFIIPQYGMVQSLNISVACAVSLFEASRQRNLLHKYESPFDELLPAHNQIYDEFVKTHFDAIRKKDM